MNKANGLIEQWLPNSNRHDFTWNFAVVFTNTNYLITVGVWVDQLCDTVIDKHESYCGISSVGKYCYGGQPYVIGY